MKQHVRRASAILMAAAFAAALAFPLRVPALAAADGAALLGRGS